MSKELTEQYFNATLKAGTYYVLNDDGIVDIDYYGGDNFQWSVVKEVLAPVPTYEEYLKLESETLAKQEGVELVAELEQKVHILNEANMAMENAIASQADFFRQQISVLEDKKEGQALRIEELEQQNAFECECNKEYADTIKRNEELEDRLKEAETVILLYFKNTQNATHQSLGMNDGYYKKAFMHTVAKEYLEKYGVEK